jgi:hypothetical protein
MPATCALRLLVVGSKRFRWETPTAPLADRSVGQQEILAGNSITVELIRFSGSPSLLVKLSVRGIRQHVTHASAEGRTLLGRSGVGGQRGTVAGPFPTAPGSRTVLPPSRPLRTARESFPSSSSSLSNVRCRTRLRHSQPLTMNLPMAVRMHEHSIFCAVASSVYSPDHMVIIPSSQGRNLLVADWADTVLLLPKEQQLPPTFEGSCHGHAEACFKVEFPRRVVWIGRAFDFRVSSNGHTMRVEEIDPASFAVFPFYVAAEDPLPVADDMKVFLLHPPPRLVGVSAAYPPP